MSHQFKNFASLRKERFNWLPFILGTIPVAISFFVIKEFVTNRKITDHLEPRNVPVLTQHEMFCIQAQAAFRTISYRCDNAPYLTLLHDYQKHILSYRQTDPKILKGRDVILIDKLFRQFPRYASELLDDPQGNAELPELPLTPYIMGLKTNMPVHKEPVKPHEPALVNNPATFGLFTQFSAEDLRKVVEIYETGAVDHALFYANNPLILRKSDRTVSNEIIEKWKTRNQDIASFVKRITLTGTELNENGISYENFKSEITDFFLSGMPPKILFPFLMLAITRSYVLTITGLLLLISLSLYEEEIMIINNFCQDVTRYTSYYYFTYLSKL